MNLEAELREVEERMMALLPKGAVSGTSLSRVLAPEKGVWWCLGLGGMTSPKRFFSAASFDELFEKAKSWLDQKEAEMK